MKKKNADGTFTQQFNRGLLRRDVVIDHDRDKDIFLGELTLHGTKTAHRKRTAPVDDDISRELVMKCASLEPDDPVFETSYMNMDFPWKKIRSKAGLNELRFKDLRAQISQYAHRAGISRAAMAAMYGHKDTQMLDRYERHAASVSHDQIAAAASIMFRAVNE